MIICLVRHPLIKHLALQRCPSSAVRSITNSTATNAPILFPSARHLAESNGKDATGLTGSGKGGRITKADVMSNLESLPALSLGPSKSISPSIPEQVQATTTAPAPVAVSFSELPLIDNNPYEDIPNSKMRKIIAKRLTESKQEVPHSYTSMDVALDNMMALRKRLLNDHQVKVSVNDFVLKCSALALRDVPQVNGSFVGNEVKNNSTVDISVAVATPTGLITPIVFGIDGLGLSQISSRVRDLSTRARDGALQPHEYQGGTFSVSNLGMFGIQQFSAVINPPQAAILAVGGGMKQLFASSSEEDANPVSKTIMTARLSSDRRVVDEKASSLFLQAFRYYMETPEVLIL